MSQETLKPPGNPASNAPAHDPGATPAPAEGPVAASLERIDVFDLASQVADNFNLDGVRVEVSGPRAVVPTHAGILRPILRLLVQDALCAAADDAPVRILVRAVGYDVDLVVKDPSVVPAEVSGAGAGLAEAGPLAKRIGARMQLSLDENGCSEVRVRLPRLDPHTTIMVVGSGAGTVTAGAARLGFASLEVSDVEDALHAMLDGGSVCACVFLPSGWRGARSRDVLALRCALLPAPVISVGPPPEVVEALVGTILEEPVAHRALREALLSARQT